MMLMVVCAHRVHSGLGGTDFRPSQEADPRDPWPAVLPSSSAPVTAHGCSERKQASNVEDGENC